MQDDTCQLGDRTRKLVERAQGHGLSLAEIADATGASLRTVYRWAEGRPAFHLFLDRLQAVAEGRVRVEDRLPAHVAA